jgi:uncharacterized integral membrane protein
MKLIGSIIKIAIVAAVILFAVMNVQQVDVTYFYNTPPLKLPMFIVLLAAVLTGAVLVSLLYLVDRLKLTTLIRQYKKKLKNAEDEINRLRNLPILEQNSETPKDSQ